MQESKGIDAVEGIEEEVRIDLRLEVLQLQLCAALALQLVEAFPFVEQPGDGGDGHGDEQEDEVLGMKPIALILTSLDGSFHLGRMAEHLSFDEFGDEEQVRFGGHDRDDNEQKQAGEVEDSLVAMQSLWRKLVLDEGPYKQHRDDGHVGDDYTTERKNFDGYVLVEVPDNADGEMTRDEITVTYYYKKIAGGVVVNHVDVATGKQLVDEEKLEGYVGEDYETEPKSIPEYRLVQERYPENAEGEFAERLQRRRIHNKRKEIPVL